MVGNPLKLHQSFGLTNHFDQNIDNDQIPVETAAQTPTQWPCAMAHAY